MIIVRDIIALGASAFTLVFAGGAIQEHVPVPVAQAAIVPIDHSAEQPAKPAPLHELTRAADSMFYVHASVNGEPVRFLVDTGASVVILNAADARKVGAVPERGNKGAKITTAGGNAAMRWTRLDHLRVAGRDVHNVRAAMIDGNLPVSLLGQNALSKLGKLTIEGDRLSLH